MARDREPAGCGCVLGALVALCFVAGFAAWGIGLVALVMAAPAIVPYLLLHQPAQFQHDRTLWIAALCAAPLLAWFLAGVRLPRRVRAGVVQAGGVRARFTNKADHRDPKDQRAFRRRRFLQASLLLAVTSVVALGMLAQGNTATGPHAFTQTTSLAGAVLVACVLLPLLFRCWDHWSPPLGEPVTVEQVRAAERAAERKLKQIRQQNDAVRHMTHQVEECLAAARHEVGFTVLREQHYTSFKCADVAHESYESTKDSRRFMATMAARARATTAPRLIPLRDPQTGRRIRPPQAELRASTATLLDHSRALAAETARGLQFVHTLNLRTADLRDTIRDTCGPRGQRWYGDLMERRDYAKA